MLFIHVNVRSNLILELKFFDYQLLFLKKQNKTLLMYEQCDKHLKEQKNYKNISTLKATQIFHNQKSSKESLKKH